MSHPIFTPEGPSKGALRIVQLYPDDMNIYGDWGNTLTLARRAAWHGYSPEIVDYNVGDAFPEDADVIVGGGGQDSGQFKIIDDLARIADRLTGLAADGSPMLVICGMYQLFGHEFETLSGRVLPGLGILDLTTKGTDERLIGNVVTESDEFGRIVGYENHSGKTVLGSGAEPLGRVVVGAGNNGEDETEGARHANVLGTYLHGSLLPKNPALADCLLRTAAERRHGEFVPGALDDSLEERARRSAEKRPR
ncbi:glutamine amidotransferase [Falsarthrobacter nasiphocae]|uniref:Lipid II isoglutaminyl synthase (glutamine-hydrolyzing) subunit GatD n=1 Tax=Falsarthrobacter nasiphocae TaxID=189863 RepID=A0AAE4C6U6_9MICC|nr:glutamine amidotransferase [Falsarthrobacter nasiphocae]MDR6892958.1 CobQ-like glutamine amidotransferase family enzyme [Falsarthrobacter nasiphocae]